MAAQSQFLISGLCDGPTARRIVTQRKSVYLQDCQLCGQAFFHRTRAAKWCSRRCQQRAYRERKCMATAGQDIATSGSSVQGEGLTGGDPDDPDDDLRAGETLWNWWARMALKYGAK